MSDLQQLIQKICKELETGGQTAPEVRQELARQYAAACRQFNADAEECRLLLERRMIMEAEQFANSRRPSLSRQKRLLEFSLKEEFLTLLSENGCEEPPPLKMEVLNALRDAVNSQKDLTPWLNAYREIARTGDTPRKILLLRRITELDSRNPEWKTVLRSLEEERLNSLTAEAKEAILRENYFRLGEIQEELASPEWSVQPNEKVMNKIDNVLENHRLEELDRLATVYLNAVNDTYSAFDYANLEKNLAKWHHFLESENYNPDMAAEMQIEEAEQYYTGQKKIKDEEALFEDAVRRLRDGLEKEAPLTQLEPLYQRISIMDRELPETVKRHYLAYREGAEELHRRKRLLKITAATLLFLAVAGGVIFIAASVIMNSEERKWTGQIGSALENEVAAVSLKLLDDLEERSPAIRKRPRIQELETKAKRKKEEEDSMRLRFQELARKLQEELKHFEKNQESILIDKTMILKLIVDHTEQTLYQEIEREYTQKQKAYQEQQDRKYAEELRQFQIVRQEFFLALEQEDMSKAEAAITRSETLREAADAIRDVSANVKINGRKYFSTVPDLKVKLEAERKVKKEKDRLLADINAPASLEILLAQTQKFLQRFPERPEAGALKVLRKNAVYANTFANTPPANAGVDSIFHKDVLKLAGITEQRRKLLAAALKQFQDMNKLNEDTPTYAIVLEDANGLLYDLYYFGETEWSRLGNECSCKIRILSDEEGNLQNVELHYFYGETNPMVQVNSESSFFSGRMIYPDELGDRAESQKPAPHVRLIKETQEAIQKGNEDTIEAILIAAANNALTRKELNPYLRWQLTRVIAGLLADAMPENKSYKAMVAATAKAAEKIPPDFNWLQSYRREGTVQRELAAELKGGAANIRMAPDEFLKSVYETALSRKLKPVGYAVMNNKGETNLVRFSGAPVSGELWLVSEDQPLLWIVGEFSGKDVKISQGAAGKLGSMQVLFSPTDSRSSKALTEKIFADARKNGIEHVPLPASWPVFAEDQP